MKKYMTEQFQKIRYMIIAVILLYGGMKMQIPFSVYSEGEPGVVQSRDAVGYGISSDNGTDVRTDKPVLPGESGSGIESVTLMLASDMHYLAPSLTDGGELFQRVVRTGDGKLPERSRELMEELIEAARDIHPAALILAGDLTYNGERQSLLEMAALLQPLQEEGIPVLVIPGNHDINYRYACRFVKDKAYRTENISQAEFKRICSRFGYDEALCACPYSFSYMYDVGGIVRLLFLDVNTQTLPGSLDEQTLTWARTQLEMAAKDGIPVMSVTHQNVLRQSDLFYQGFVISNEEEAAGLLRDGGVHDNFSGHSHICHTTIADGLTDHAVGSMSVAPLPYTVISVQPDGSVETQTCRLETYADEAKERFAQCTGRQLREALENLEIPPETREEMIDFAVETNAAYFAGTPDKDLRKKKGWTLWEKYGKGTFWYFYMNSMMPDVVA